MKIYVQVPITGRALYEARNEAAELAAKVREAGHEAVTPFDLGIAEDATSQQALPRCIEALLDCDALLLHPANVERSTGKDLPSRGCMAEALTAMTYHLGIYVVEDGAIRLARGSGITLTLNTHTAENELRENELRGVYYSGPHLRYENTSLREIQWVALVRW